MAGIVDKAPVIALQDVCFSYGAHEVLHNVTFQVRPREMLAVVGPNGGGKSTLLQLLLGLQSPRLGAVRIFGSVPCQARGRIGYVPQHLHVDPQFPVSVLDVVRMGRVERHAVGPYRKTDDAAAQAALAQVGIEDLQNHPFAHLSGGQRQRVLIAQALATEAELLLLDEPTANVDPKAEHELVALFGKLRQHKTLVFVSHNVNVVTHHASHVLCVNRTAVLHPIGEVMASTLREAYGGELAVLTHDQDCHVMDASQAPHCARAEAPLSKTSVDAENVKKLQGTAAKRSAAPL